MILFKLSGDLFPIDGRFGGLLFNPMIHGQDDDFLRSPYLSW